MLGDWVNLSWHQKAAYDALTRLYTPETIIQSEFMRKVLLWYIRFDLFVGFQSGGESVLGREWYVVLYDYYAQKARENPEDIGMKYEERFGYSRLAAKDANDLFARKARGQLTDEKFMDELPKVANRINNLDKNIDPSLLDPSEHVANLSGEPDPDDIVNPFEPNIIWSGKQWTTNYLIMDMYGIICMFQIQISHALRKPFDPDLKNKARRVAQVFEAICLYPKAPPGAIIEAQASLAIATLFLPKDPKTIQWCRRTFAKIESAGYVSQCAPSHQFPRSASCCCALHWDSALIGGTGLLRPAAMANSNPVTSIRIHCGTGCLNSGDSNIPTGGCPTTKTARTSSAQSRTSYTNERWHRRTRPQKTCGK